MLYLESDWLDLSGILQFSICRRRWALIAIDGVWADNVYTIHGSMVHERAHDSDIVESRVDKIMEHALRVHSERLGIVGECDVVEFLKSDEGIILHNRSGTWQPYPVEYKSGDGTYIDSDALQLCGQAMCLEEMLCCSIPNGALFYHKTRRRVPVEFTPELREKTEAIISEMHTLWAKRHIPRVKKSKICKSCSLNEHCNPDGGSISDVRSYIKKYLGEDV